MKIDSINLREIRMRLKSPFETSFGVIQNRRILLVEVSADGVHGWGEVTTDEGPFYISETIETAWHILSDFIAPQFIGRNLSHASEFPNLFSGIRGHEMAKAAVENAIWDIESQLAGIPLSKLIGGTLDEIACGVSLGIRENPQTLVTKVEEELQSGYQRIKLKIKPGKDLEFVSAVRKQFPEILLSVDANSAYRLEDAPHLKKLDDFRLLMMEQPLEWDEIYAHAKLQSQLQTSICLDECIHNGRHASAAIELGACRIINIKLGRVGGFSEARRIHDLCRTRSIPVWCGGMLESGVGRAHNVAMSTLPGFTLPGDVSASKRYWHEDIIEPEVQVSSNGTIAVPTTPGLGYNVKRDLVERLTTRENTWKPQAILVALIALFCVLGRVSAADQPNIPPRQDYADVAALVKHFIQQQMTDKQLPALSIAIVDGQQVVWAEGFGFADPKSKTPATAETTYRIGSVSKLFTDIAVMQLAERGQVDLDAPVTTYLPEFHPKNPFGKPITLRQLMSHQSGLLREPPVGNYFDPTEPSLAQTVNSLNETELVYAPQTRVKYSNAAIAVVGYVLEKRSNQPFAAYLKQAVLDPLAIEHSSFEPTPAITKTLAKGEMWTYDGRIFDAPTFQLGIAPAGSMYSTVTDLGRFVSMLLARGKTPTREILKPESLDAMWKPQFPNSGGAVFGLGFHLSGLDNHRMVGHDGAIYGFATTLDLLPDDNLGAIVVTTKDLANDVTDRVAEQALRLTLAHREGKPLALPPSTTPVSADLARRVAGRYGTGAEALDLKYLNGKLTALRATSGYQVELRQSNDDLVVDDVLTHGMKIKPLKNAMQIGSKILERIEIPEPADAPERWKKLIGEYGWDHDTLYVFEKDGRLTVLIEWAEYDPLSEISKDEFAFPNHGLYDGEKAVFTRAGEGKATQVRVSGVVFKRRPIGGVAGGTFRIPPVKNIDALRKEALAAHPPAEKGAFRDPDLVQPTSLDPTIKLDIRYASTNNFLSTPMYSEARAFLQRPAAEAVVRANHKLEGLGYGLLIHDAYRPWYVTKMFWDATPDDKKIFVANPSEGSRHNRGCAVDLTLYSLATGKPIEMVGVYDEMSERSYPGYPGGTSLQRWHRELLRHAMEAEGFEVYEYEWWHFDYKDWRTYPILNLTFAQLASARSDRHSRVN